MWIDNGYTSNNCFGNGRTIWYLKLLKLLLLNNNPHINTLINNPFKNKIPPKYIHTLIYEYNISNEQNSAKWWIINGPILIFDTLTLDSFKQWNI